MIRWTIWTVWTLWTAWTAGAQAEAPRPKLARSLSAEQVERVVTNAPAGARVYVPAGKNARGGREKGKEEK